MQNDSYLERLYIYSQERFNLWQFIPLALILAGVLAGGTQIYLNQKIFIVPILLTATALFLFLLRLRIFDEFKDYDHDLIYYSHRPVPRGLITKKELKNILIPIFFLELIIAFISGYNGLILFLLSFGYSILMLKEFYIRNWIRSHFTVYILTHEMLLLPLFFYLCAINGFKLIFLADYFFWLLITFVGLFIFLLEITRKVRSKDEEIASKDTYTAQYGIQHTSLLLLAVSTLAVFILGELIHILRPDYLLLILISFLLLSFFFWRLYKFNMAPSPKTSKQVFLASVYFVFISCLITIIIFIK